MCVVGGVVRSRSRISYCSRCGWSAEPSLSSPLPDSARCCRRPPEARSWVVSLLRGNKQTSGWTSTVSFGHPPAGGESAFTSAARPDAEAWLPIAARAQPGIGAASWLFYSHLSQITEFCSCKQPRGATTSVEKGKKQEMDALLQHQHGQITSMFSVPHSRRWTDRQR